MTHIDFHTKIGIFTKSVSGILVSPSTTHLLVYTFREYGLSFMSNPANTPNTLEGPTILTKTVSEVRT